MQFRGCFAGGLCEAEDSGAVGIVEEVADLELLIWGARWMISVGTYWLCGIEDDFLPALFYAVSDIVNSLLQGDDGACQLL